MHQITQILHKYFCILSCQLCPHMLNFRSNACSIHALRCTSVIFAAVTTLHNISQQKMMTDDSISRFDSVKRQHPSLILWTLSIACSYGEGCWTDHLRYYLGWHGYSCQALFNRLTMWQSSALRSCTPLWTGKYFPTNLLPAGENAPVTEKMKLLIACPESHAFVTFPSSTS